MAVGSKLNNYIDDSFKANSDDDSGDGGKWRHAGDDDDDGDEIEEPKLLPYSLSTAPLLASAGSGGAQAAGLA
jgi:hypothetical protein